MIVLDTHIWVWWAHASEQLTRAQEQIIVATARFYDCPLITSDKRILNYPHVKTIV
jgi:PIN domain nuclease of toxin-antitoxin system